MNEEDEINEFVATKVCKDSSLNCDTADVNEYDLANTDFSDFTTLDIETDGEGKNCNLYLDDDNVFEDNTAVDYATSNDMFWTFKQAEGPDNSSACETGINCASLPTAITIKVTQEDTLNNRILVDESFINF